MGTDNGVLRPDLEGIAARAEAARAVGTPYPVPHQILATAADLPAVTAYALQLEVENLRLRDENRTLRATADKGLRTTTSGSSTPNFGDW